MFYVYLCNEPFESEANGFACYINDIQVKLQMKLIKLTGKQ